MVGMMLKSTHPRIWGATSFGGEGANLLPTTDVLQAMAYKPQHWDW